MRAMSPRQRLMPPPHMLPFRALRYTRRVEHNSGASPRAVVQRGDEIKRSMSTFFATSAGAPIRQPRRAGNQRPPTPLSRHNAPDGMKSTRGVGKISILLLAHDAFVHAQLATRNECAMAPRDTSWRYHYPLLEAYRNDEEISSTCSRVITR